MADASTFLRATFREVLALGLGAPVLLGGCSDSGIENDPGFVEVTCNDGEPNYLTGVEPADPVDYLARGIHALDQPFLPREEVGVPCAGAQDQEACLAAIDAAPQGDSSLQLGENGQLIIYQEIVATRGDDVINVLSAAQLRTFLGPIDSVADAVLLASSNGFTVTCSRSGARPVGDGFRVQLFTHPGCDGRRRHLLHVNAVGEIVHLDGVTEREPEPLCVVGRRPAGLTVRQRDLRGAAAHFAHSAELEAASVLAFESLERELTAHRAPSLFAARARAAARDEVRHARDVARLSRTLGGKPKPPRVLPLRHVRPLEAIALENAVEGCVRETYGVLVALHQSRRARQPEVRRLYARIAEDETRHAALAWDVARWAEVRCGIATRRRIAAATRRSVDALVASAHEPVSDELAEVAGLPRPDTARVMLEGLAQRLWLA